MRVSQRQVVLALLTILIVGALIALIYQLVMPDTNSSLINTGVSLLVLLGLFIAYWRGWEQARYATLILTTLLIILATEGVYITEKFTLTAFLPPALALIVAGPIWIVGSALFLLAGLIVRAGGQGVYVDPLSLMIYFITVGGLLLARMVMNSAQREAEENAAHARDALARSEAQAHELAQKAQELAAQNAEQQKLIDLVSTLETPAVSLADGVLLAPVVGQIDSRRISELTRRLLSEVSAQRASMVILDIAGVPSVDTSVAQALLRTIQAIRLLGCEVTITGISASVAATMTQLGINMAGVRTARTPQEVISADLTIAARPSRN